MSRRSTDPTVAASPTVLASRLRAAGDSPAASSIDEALVFTPTDFVNTMNQTLEYAYGSMLIEGEVASFKVNQNKWVFFDLKDDESSVSCFMTLYQMRIPLEDGMKVVVRAIPKLTKWGKFSLTVQAIKPVGEGSLKKAFDLLKKKLMNEGLFDQSKKRKIPKDLAKLGVISSIQAAGYADFIKIINARWGGIEVQVAHTQVQGLDAPDQIIRALKYFNEKSEVQAIAIIRGGGSADDLSCFNDEELVRAVAASKIPIITGIGHEIDESLTDLAADMRGSTPSNVAEMLTPDRKDFMVRSRMAIERFGVSLIKCIDDEKKLEREKVMRMTDAIMMKISELQKYLLSQIKILEAHDPEKILKQGYVILKGDIALNNVVKITTLDKEIKAIIKEINERK